MVVDAQGNLTQQGLGILRQQRGGSHIGADDGLVALGRGFCQAFMEPPKPIGNFLILQHIGDLPQLPQT